MRILYVISDLGPGGAEKQLVEVARALDAAGHAVAIYTLNSSVARARELAGSGVTLMVDQKRLRLDPAVLWRLRCAIGAFRADVVHGFLFDGDLYARIAACGTGVPVLNSERSDAYDLSSAQRLAHWLTRPLAQGVVANTYAGQAFALRRYRLAPEDVHVIWNGLRVEELERQAAAGGEGLRSEFFDSKVRSVACLVGAIRPEKDYLLALEAADRLVELQPDWGVLLVGDRLRDATDGYKAEVLRRHAALPRRSRIRFAGLRSDVPRLLAQCDVLYSTSRREGFPNVVLEAMGLGLPVVSTAYSDIRRILPAAAQVVERDPDAIARGVLYAAANREELAARQKEWLLAHATMQRAAAQFERVYRKYAALEQDGVQPA